MLEVDFYNALKGIAPGGAYPARLPKDPTFPCIAFFQITGTPIQNQQNYLRFVRMQVDVWAEVYDEVVLLAQQVMQTLDHYRSAGISVLLVGEHELDDSRTGLFRRVLEFDVWGN